MHKNIKPRSTGVILTLFFLSISFVPFQTLSSVAQASAESQPPASELIADASTMARADSSEVKPISDVAYGPLPGSPQSEPLKLLLLGSFLLLIATGVQTLSSRKNKPKSKPA